MGSRWLALAAAALVLVIGGCSHPAQVDLPAVGTCVVSDDQGERRVPCDEEHTHKVIAIAPRPEDCPRDTAMYASPADPDDGTTTACYKRDSVRR
jgi:hypothetical protein